MTKNVKDIFGEVDYSDKYLDKGIIPLIKEINKLNLTNNYQYIRMRMKVRGEG